MSTRTRFEEEAKGNSQMAYWSKGNQGINKLEARVYAAFPLRGESHYVRVSVQVWWHATATLKGPHTHTELNGIGNSYGVA